MKKRKKKRPLLRAFFIIVVLLAIAAALFTAFLFIRPEEGRDQKRGDWPPRGSRHLGVLLTGAGLDGEIERILPVEAQVSFGGETQEWPEGLLLADGRLFLEEQRILQQLQQEGIAPQAQFPGDWRGSAVSAAQLRRLTLNGVRYISINQLCYERKLWPVFTEQGLVLYSKTEESWKPPQRSRRAAESHKDLTFSGSFDSAVSACLRLEDIMADPSPEGRFTHEKLEKLRVLARFLQAQEQEFSIAWIPLYTNPKTHVQNDLIQEMNWYNADFLYTLDTLAQCGGHIGLHGLTHQYGEEISADGYEFGKDSPFSEEEMRRRLQRALSIAGKLGYYVEFFEFPHYGMTKAQGRIAEQYFSVIYQQELWTKPYGYVEIRENNGRQILYVPTPADCVQSEYDKEGMLQRMAASKNAGQLVSLFFHPSLDYERISCVDGEEGSRRLAYDEAGGILPAIVAQLNEWGMSFAVAWQGQ